MGKKEIRKKEDAGTSDFQLDRLEKNLKGGLQFTNLLASSNQEDTQSNRILLYSLIEVLVGKGVIHVHELEERRKMLVESINQHDEQKPKVHLLDVPDKYDQRTEIVADIDCRKNHSICKGMCCTLWFALSVQDLDEGITKWNYSQPYAIAQDQDGYCVHLNRADYSCSIYENRPLICRTFDCRRDDRIWSDFGKKVINPKLTQKQK
jgi:Fe-S-cluster containining protein